MTVKTYHICLARQRPEFKGAWDGPVWKRVESLDVSYYRPESSDHRPRTRAKLLYGLEGIYGLFKVDDRYVRCVHRRHQDPVYKDSCVEFFIQPKSGGGYFNFEFNCGGTLLASYVLDPMRTENGFADFVRFNKSDIRQVGIYHSQPKITDPEVRDPLTWYLEFFIPYQLMEKFCGPVDITSDAIWRGNLYKCADDTSHPHWGAWSPVDALNFHLPHCFGEFAFLSNGPDA